MDFTKVIKLVLKFLVAVTLVIIVAIAALLYVGNSGIPFIEGDHRVTSGKAYEFEIGMSKSEAFNSILKNYAKEDYYLRTLWLRHSPMANNLADFENTESRKYKNKKHSEYKILIRELKEMPLPLVYISRWDIDMPADWVNTIYLEFINDNLIRIQKSRWLFERP